MCSDRPVRPGICFSAIVAIFVFAFPVAADSDVWITCSDDFGVFDRFDPGGRTLHVVPWLAEGDLEIAGSVRMVGTQPHAWAIYDRYVVVRSWNGFYIYYVDDQYQPELLFSHEIDEVRSPIGGTTAIEMSGSVLRVFGIERTIILDLTTCADGCSPEVAGASELPVPDYSRQCQVHKDNHLFGLTVAITRGEGVHYHDVFLTRRDTRTGRGVADPFAPESILFLGTRETTFH